MIEPLRISFEVWCSPAHAFATWTEKATAWWPKGHTVSRSDDLAIVFEPRVGGRIYERARGGQTFKWGEVRAWDPPDRIAYLWHIGTDRESATEVEIRFLEIDPERTRVEIVHGGWERLGAERGAAWREQNQGGWDGVIPFYSAACAAGQAAID